MPGADEREDGGGRESAHRRLHSTSLGPDAPTASRSANGTPPSSPATSATPAVASQRTSWIVTPRGATAETNATGAALVALARSTPAACLPPYSRETQPRSSATAPPPASAPGGRAGPAAGVAGGVDDAGDLAALGAHPRHRARVVDRRRERVVEV